MIFKVEKLGPVERAEIDLSKDLILLTGPNGTGKTYVAWAVYGFLQTWQGYPFTKILHDVLEPVADGLLKNGDSEFDVASVVRHHSAEIVSTLEGAYSDQIAGDFAAEEALFKSTTVRIDAADDIWQQEPRGIGYGTRLGSPWSVTSRRNGSSSKILIAATKRALDDAHVQAFQNTGSVSEHVVPLGQLPQEARAEIRDSVVDVLASWIIAARRYLAPVIFPAERIATTIFAPELLSHRNELVAEMFGHVDAGMAAALRRGARRYPKPIHDSLQMAANLQPWTREQSEFSDLADYLEKDLLRGKMRLSQYGQLTFVPAQRTDVALDVHIAASMVKSLSLLVFYLRHMAQAGEMLIIDEPELNLHPDNQRLIARVLARAVNRGLKVMASTHSDYLIRELNNLIMLGQDTEAIKALRHKHGYDEAELLKPAQLGVYLFQNNTAEVVPVDETGFAVTTIDDEINKLNAVSQEIYATLFDEP